MPLALPEVLRFRRRRRRRRRIDGDDDRAVIENVSTQTIKAAEKVAEKAAGDQIKNLRVEDLDVTVLVEGDKHFHRRVGRRGNDGRGHGRTSFLAKLWSRD
jgi:hypothetical protein